jgi:hypothetical protein
LRTMYSIDWYSDQAASAPAPKVRVCGLAFWAISAKNASEMSGYSSFPFGVSSTSMAVSGNGGASKHTVAHINES